MIAKRSRNHTLLVAAAASAAFLLGLGGLAHATTWGISGTLCNPTNGTATQLDYSQYGVHNLSNVFDASVWCGVTSPQNATFGQLDVLAYDRSTSENVSCSAFSLNSSGVPFFVQTSGTGFANWDTAIMRFGFSSFPASVYGVALTCTIPKMTSLGFSHVASIQMTSSP